MEVAAPDDAAGGVEINTKAVECRVTIESDAFQERSEMRNVEDRVGPGTEIPKVVAKAGNVAAGPEEPRFASFIDVDPILALTHEPARDAGTSFHVRP